MSTQEHPQIIACVLSYLKPQKVAIILQNLPDDFQVEITRRIATLDTINPEILREIERILEKQLCSMSNDDYKNPAVLIALVEFLNQQ